MGAFSGVVRLSDVSDFIAPSQACVVNIQGGKLPEKERVQVRAILQAFHELAAEHRPSGIRITSLLVSCSTT